jgi:predicted amidohydrolase
MHILSAIQFRPRLATCLADVQDNFRKCESLIQRARDVGSSLIVFPELALTGYSFLSPEEAGRVGERRDGLTYRAMASVASDLKAYVAWGYVEFDGGKLYNSSSLVDPDGRIVSRSRKLNLWGNDFLWATPGSGVPAVAETDLGLLSLSICRDLRDKVPQNVPRTASREPGMFKGRPVDIVAACTAWGKGGFPSTTWMDFAVNNSCTLVVANRWGEERSGSFVQDFGHGGSAIIRPDWRVQTGGLAFGEDCVVSAPHEPA